MYTDSRLRNGTRNNRRRRVVGRRSNRDRAAQACPLDHLVEEGAEDSGRRDDVREDSGRQSKSLEEVGRPRLRSRVEALGRRRVRVLTRCDARKPEVEEIRDQKEGLSDLERPLVCRDSGEELNERVDRHGLDGRALVDCRAPGPRRKHFHCTLGAPIPVVYRVLDQPAIAIQETEVHSPGIDSDRIDGARHGAHGGQVPRGRPAGAHTSRRRAAGTGTFGKRCTSTTERRSPSKVPSATRPLCAPRSTAAMVVTSHAPK